MRTFSWFAMAALMTAAMRGSASEPKAQDHLPRVEPRYASTDPQYCLLLFGREADVRVWAVLDGDVLYLDRNGNGDLTDPGECIAARSVYRGLKERPDVKVMRQFELSCWHEGCEPVLTCGPEVQRFHLSHTVPHADGRDRAGVQRFTERPIDISITTNIGRDQRASLRFSNSAHTAPVLHFDSPLRLALSERFGLVRFCPGEICNLVVELRPQGVAASVRTDVAELPADVYPVATIEFPPAQVDARPLRVRVELSHRC